MLHFIYYYDTFDRGDKSDDLIFSTVNFDEAQEFYKSYKAKAISWYTVLEWTIYDANKKTLEQHDIKYYNFEPEWIR